MKLSRDNIVVWVGGAVLVVLAVGPFVGLTWEELFICSVVAAFIALCAWIAFTDGRLWIHRDYTGLSPRDVQAIVRDQFDRPGWWLKRQERQVLTYERRMPVNVGAAVFLAFL